MSRIVSTTKHTAVLLTVALMVAFQSGCVSSENAPAVVANSGSPNANGAGGSTVPTGGVPSSASGGQNSQSAAGTTNSTGTTTGGVAAGGGGTNVVSQSGGAGTGGAGTGGAGTGGAGTGGGSLLGGLGGAAATGGRSTGGASAGGTTSTGGSSTTTGGVSATGGATTASVGGSSANCGLSDNSAGDRSKRQFLVRDEGLHQIAFLELATPTRNWYTVLASEVSSGIQGRDMQLVGNCRVMVGTDLGYEEYDIASGARLAQLTTYAGTVAAHRLRNKNTLLVGLGTSSAPYQGSSGIVLAEVNAAGSLVTKTVYAGFSYVRLVRETPAGTYLVTSNTQVFEGRADGTILSQRFNITGTANPSNVAAPHAWKALRLPNGETLIGTGYGATLSYYTATGTVRRAITGGATNVNPSFYADFQLLANGNVLVVNWQGHDAGNWSKGLQLLEYTPEGTLAWSLQDTTLASKLSSLQAAILLDGLDATKLHVEDTTGQLVAVE